MKYYVFGGNGFVGRYLCNSLAKDGKVVVAVDIQDELDMRIDGDVSYLKADIRDKSAIMNIDIRPDDLVVNMAATQYHTKVPKNRKEYFFNTNFFLLSSLDAAE